MNAIDQHRKADELRAAGGKKDGGDNSFYAQKPTRFRVGVARTSLRDMRN